MEPSSPATPAATAPRPRPLIRYPERNMAVDFLRGVAILLVVFSHINALRTLGAPALVPAWFLDAVRPNGGLGVSVFFVISGFLITQNALERFGELGRISLRAFYTYRASRILPALLLLVVCNLIGAAFVLWGFVIPPTIPVSKLLTYVFTFRFNLLYVDGGALLTAWAPLWSLAIEEVFYLSFPLAALLLRRSWLLVPVLLGLAIYGPYFRHQLGWGAFYLYWGCFDQLALGCLAALLARQVKAIEWPRRALLALQLAGATVLTFSYLRWDMHVDDHWSWLPTVMGIGAGLFLLGSPGTAPGPATAVRRFVRPIGLAGFLSYELYLFHLPALLLLKAPLHALAEAWHFSLPVDFVFLFFIVALTFLMAVLHTWFSEPSMRFMRRHLAPARPLATPSA